MNKRILIKDGKAYITKEGKVLSANVEGGGSSGTPIELSTSAEMQAVLVAGNIGKIYKYVGETNDTFTNGNLYQVMEVE